jgi:hypothetical protein
MHAYIAYGNILSSYLTNFQTRTTSKMTRTHVNLLENFELTLKRPASGGPWKENTRTNNAAKKRVSDQCE